MSILGRAVRQDGDRPLEPDGYPLVLGSGKKLFSDGIPPARFSLVESRALKSGVLINLYRRGT
jgi:hypothetical protein